MLRKITTQKSIKKSRNPEETKHIKCILGDLSIAWINSLSGVGSSTTASCNSGGLEAEEYEFGVVLPLLAPELVTTSRFARAAPPGLPSLVFIFASRDDSSSSSLSSRKECSTEWLEDEGSMRMPRRRAKEKWKWNKWKIRKSDNNSRSESSGHTFQLFWFSPVHWRRL